MSVAPVQDVQQPAGKALKEETLTRRGFRSVPDLTLNWERTMRSPEVLSGHTVPEAMTQSVMDSFKLNIRQGHNPWSTDTLV